MGAPCSSPSRRPSHGPSHGHGPRSQLERFQVRGGHADRQSTPNVSERELRRRERRGERGKRGERLERERGECGERRIGTWT
jgi:hypothetical protein